MQQTPEKSIEKIAVKFFITLITWFVPLPILVTGVAFLFPYIEETLMEHIEMIFRIWAGTSLIMVSAIMLYLMINALRD